MQSGRHRETLRASPKLHRCYTQCMPTTRPRHFVTESDDLAVALDAAAKRWPGVSRGQLVLRLALEGHRASQRAQDERQRRRLAAVGEHSGVLTGAYPADYLDQLRAEWPQ